MRSTSQKLDMRLHKPLKSRISFLIGLVKVAPTGRRAVALQEGVAPSSGHIRLMIGASERGRNIDVRSMTLGRSSNLP